RRAGSPWCPGTGNGPALRVAAPQGPLVTPPGNRDAGPGDLVEAALLAVVVAAAAVAVLFLSLSRAAAALFGHGPFPAHMDDALVALGRLPRHWSDPAQAW